MVVAVLSRCLPKCAEHSISTTIFIISYKTSSSLSVHFYSVSFRKSSLIRSVCSGGSGVIFAIYCFAIKIDLNFLTDVGGYNSIMALIYSVLFSTLLFRVPAQLFFGEKSGFFFLACSRLLCIQHLRVSRVFQINFPMLFSSLLLLLYRLATRVSGVSMFGLLLLRILSVCQRDRKILPYIYNTRSCFFPVIANLLCLLLSSDNFSWPYAYSRSVLDIHKICFVILFFQWLFDIMFLQCLAFMVSILCNYRKFFLNALQFFPVYLSSWLTLLVDTKQSHSIFCIFLTCLEWINLFASFLT